MHTEINSIPLGRILEKLDYYLAQKDFDAAEKHLQYWLSESDACHDMRGKLALLNEQIGFYRKTCKEKECFCAITEALALANSMDIEKSAALGTTLVNSATGYKAFGKAEDAIPLYRRARMIYESILDSNDGRLGALYNNMAQALVDLKEFDDARDLYNKAIAVMEKQENGAIEVAITCLNLADLVWAQQGAEAGEKEIEKYLLKAEKLLNTESLPRDSYYAFVCEKCAPAFGTYGYFLIEEELNKRAKEITEKL